MVACFNSSTFAVFENVIAFFCYNSRCSLFAPAMPITKLAVLPFQSTPSG